jgi:hypothetical protein
MFMSLPPAQFITLLLNGDQRGRSEMGRQFQQVDQAIFGNVDLIDAGVPVADQQGYTRVDAADARRLLCATWPPATGGALCEQRTAL